MDNSRKSIILSRKQFNTNSPITSSKKLPLLPYHYSNQKNTSYQNANNHQGGVSYAELQIILENIHKVKIKASETISGLQKKNRSMQQELKCIKEQIKRYENLQQTIKKQRQIVEIQFKQKIMKMQNQILKVEQINKQHYKNQIIFKKQLDNKNNTIQELNKIIKKYSEQLENSQGKYQKITKILKINQNSSQLSNIKQNYIDIPNLLQIATSLKMNEQHHLHSIQQLSKHNQQLRNQISQNNKTINAIAEQNRQLLLIIETLSKQKESLIAEIALFEAEKSKMMKDKDNTLTEISDQISMMKKNCQNMIKQREGQVHLLQQQIKGLEDKLIQAADHQRIIKQEQEFKMVVDQICDQNQDYQNVMKRIQYLEKYRMEYYFNIQKIQFVCKILDK